MSVKQDRQGVRTASELERKYNFGKTFSEMIGLINESRDKVDSVESELRNEIIEQSTSITRNTEQIVMQAEQRLTNTINEVDGKLTDIEKEVSLKLDSEAVKISVRQEISSGVNVGDEQMDYRFDLEGLTIAQKGNEIANRINNTGMFVEKNGNPILTANKDGVDAVNLHASDYLIVGKGDGRSRFEDYGIDRTGCFWGGKG